LILGIDLLGKGRIDVYYLDVGVRCTGERKSVPLPAVSISKRILAPELSHYFRSLAISYLTWIGLMETPKA
jgi:hypothetical protein